MLVHYAMRNLVDYVGANPKPTPASIAAAVLGGEREQHWVNLGGQLALERDVDRLLADIKSNRVAPGAHIHERYDALWAAYPLQKQKHALACLLLVSEASGLTEDLWQKSLDEAMQIQELIRDQVFATRKKDYDNHFRQITFRNHGEMDAVMGRVEDNSFVKQVRQDTEAFREKLAAIRSRTKKANAVAVTV